MGRVTLVVSLSLACAGPSAMGARPGDLDPTFGSGGVVSTRIGDGGIALAVAGQPDGKVLAAGSSNRESTIDLRLVRYDRHGGLDATFGTGGLATPIPDALAYDLVLQADGKVVVAGRGNGRFLLARYESDGQLDASFGAGGVVTTAIGAESTATAVVQQPDGKLVVAGYACSDGGCHTTTSCALARYGVDGTLDPTFGTGGTVTSSVSGYDIVNALVQQPDGKLVVGGHAGQTEYVFLLGRYEADGSPDATFGLGGSVTTAIDEDAFAYGLARQANGKLVLVGSSRYGLNSRIGLVRYNVDGSLDDTFGGIGIVYTAIGTFSGATAVVVQPDQKIVVGGAGIFESGRFALARYSQSGNLDPTFGVGGIVTTVIGGSAGAQALALQPDGTLVAAGQHDFYEYFALARYLGDCGDGALEHGEECDDGEANGTSSSCCSTTCHFDAAGAPCVGDDDLCTNDACDGAGTCTHVVAPAADCTESSPEGGTLRLVGAEGRTAAIFTWGKSPLAVGVDDFGSPKGETEYRLCVYDEKSGAARVVYGGRVDATEECGPALCWTRRPRGWRFRSKSGAPDGITAVGLRAGGVNSARIRLAARRAPVLAPLPLDVSPRVTAQLRTSAGKCWGATFATRIERNDTVEFRATSD